jgi:transcriptional regulator with XRE-family HTH domain
MDTPLTALRDYRKRENKTLDDIVEALQIQCNFKTTKASLSRIENGKQPANLDLLRHLRTVTGLTIGELAQEAAE